MTAYIYGNGGSKMSDSCHGKGELNVFGMERRQERNERGRRSIKIWWVLTLTALVISGEGSLGWGSDDIWTRIKPEEHVQTISFLGLPLITQTILPTTQLSWPSSAMPLTLVGYEVRAGFTEKTLYVRITALIPREGVVVYLQSARGAGIKKIEITPKGDVRLSEWTTPETPLKPLVDQKVKGSVQRKAKTWMATLEVPMVAWHLSPKVTAFFAVKNRPPASGRQVTWHPIVWQTTEKVDDEKSIKETYSSHDLCVLPWGEGPGKIRTFTTKMEERDDRGRLVVVERRGVGVRAWRVGSDHQFFLVKDLTMDILDASGRYQRTIPVGQETDHTRVSMMGDFHMDQAGAFYMYQVVYRTSEHHDPLNGKIKGVTAIGSRVVKLAPDGTEVWSIPILISPDEVMAAKGEYFSLHLEGTSLFLMKGSRGRGWRLNHIDAADLKLVERIELPDSQVNKWPWHGLLYEGSIHRERESNTFVIRAYDKAGALVKAFDTAPFVSTVGGRQPDSIRLLNVDRGGNLFYSSSYNPTKACPFDDRAVLEIHKYSLTGELKARISLPRSGWKEFVPLLEVSAEGGVFEGEFMDDGIHLREWRWQNE